MLKLSKQLDIVFKKRVFIVENETERLGKYEITCYLL